MSHRKQSDSMLYNCNPTGDMPLLSCEQYEMARLPGGAGLLTQDIALLTCDATCATNVMW